MKLSKADHISTDVLIIGGGGAGLRAAIAARRKGATVLIVSKSQIGLGNNTALSKGAFAAATGWGDIKDSPEIHVKDTLEGGRFINDVPLLNKVTNRIVHEVLFLEECGVPFWKEKQKFFISRVPGHSYARNFVSEDQRGTNFTFPLKKYALESGVNMMEGVFISRLLTEDGEFVGATGIDYVGNTFVITAKAMVLATGGLGHIYLNTDNAVGMTGDGYALAFQAGIPLRDMEFVQFYPTALMGKRIILYEFFIMELGGLLKNSRGENVMAKYGLEDPLAMTRDRLSRACMTEILEGNDVAGGMVMDLHTISEEKIRRYRHLLPANTPPDKREFTVSPTVHFFMGGISTDEEARTCIDGIFACGEVSGGMHGANRIGGNALSEVFAMGGVAGENAAAMSQEKGIIKPKSEIVDSEWARLESLFRDEQVKIQDLIRSIKETSWYQAGIIRNQSSLKQALERVRELRSQAEIAGVSDPKNLIKRLELNNMLLVAELISRAALERTESRGAHYREDYPDEDDSWRANLFIHNKKGELDIEKKPAG
jgi:succinate dehydrogenase/fumarate reductase flavoprotein subunit